MGPITSNDRKWNDQAVKLSGEPYKLELANSVKMTFRDYITQHTAYGALDLPGSDGWTELVENGLNSYVDAHQAQHVYSA